MTDEKWLKVSAMIESKFTVLEHGHEDLNPGTAEFYVFEAPPGKLKLERTIRPKLVDRKMHVSKRIGGTGAEERIYSDDEEVSFLKAYIWNEDVNSWSTFDLDGFLG